ncbi:hypothetical protein [Caballeronia mineralivorans]|uniref:hypothetical protein n=1 Tax=Caballeronia mineralivorans TaxID=2010198 RepID=UPI002AFDDB06|nr:hypothetical protein [Caballeronia mineralivorans]
MVKPDAFVSDRQHDAMLRARDGQSDLGRRCVLNSVVHTFPSIPKDIFFQTIRYFTLGDPEIDGYARACQALIETAGDDVSAALRPRPSRSAGCNSLQVCRRSPIASWMRRTVVPSRTPVNILKDAGSRCRWQANLGELEEQNRAIESSSDREG